MNNYQRKRNPFSPEICRLFHDPLEHAKPLSAVIVTLSGYQSYDQLFDTQKQEAPEGCRVSVWKLELSASNMNVLKNFLERTDESYKPFKDLFDELKELEPSSVVFNFECSGGCSDSTGFGSRDMDLVTIKAISLMIEKGYYVMVSDFTLKALLARWDDKLLGHCPFIQIGTYHSSCELKFIPGVLKECDSSQLVSLGLLCENGQANVRALGDTIIFAPRANMNLSNEPYSLEILTVATRLDNSPVIIERFRDAAKPYTLAKIKEHEGAVGQAILSYKTGGRLIMSSCHWVELTHINTTEERVFQTYAMNNGIEYERRKRAEYDAAPESERSSRLQQFAREIVQNSAPCKYSKRNYRD